MNAPTLTKEKIIEAATRFREVRGRHPNTQDGAASRYFRTRRHETWAGVNVCLRRGLRGLPGGETLKSVLKEAAVVTEKAPLNQEDIEEALVAYYQENGCLPCALNTEMVPALGSSWATLNGTLQKGHRGLPGGDSVHQMAVRLGLVEPVRRPDLTVEIIEEGVRRFHAEHGKAPTQLSGDATAYVGCKTSWKSIDSRLRVGSCGFPGGDSLMETATRLGLRNGRGYKPSLSYAKIENAVRHYIQRTGRTPHNKCGDATEDFGHPETWSAIEGALQQGLRGLPGGSTLGKLKRDLDIHP